MMLWAQLDSLRLGLFLPLYPCLRRAEAWQWMQAGEAMPRAFRTGLVSWTQTGDEEAGLCLRFNNQISEKE